MRIGHVVPRAGRLGGYERQARLLASAQSSAVDLGLQPLLVTRPEEVSPAAWRRDIRVLPVARGSEADDALREVDLLHIHALDPFSGLLAAAALRASRPFIVKIATQGDVSLFAQPDPSKLLASRLLRARPVFRSIAAATWGRRKAGRFRAAWQVLRRAHAFIALNEAVAAELKVAGVDPIRIHLWPNAVQIPDEPAPHRPQGMHALCIARAEPRKRLTDLLAALPIVQARHPRATLTLLTTGPEVDLVASAAERIPGLSVVSDAPNPIDALRAADVFLFPSEREGCPNALLEAAAVGLPCIASRIPGVREWFRDETEMLMHAPGDVDGIARLWTALLSDPSRRASLALAARAAVADRASLPALLPRYADLYRSVIAAASAPLT